MDSTRKIALVTGVLFVVTFITAIPAQLSLYVPVLTDPRYIVGTGAADTSVSLGALLELILIIANVGTALALFPILKRQNEALALGYVSARIVECVFIAIGIVSLLSVVTLRQDFAGAAGADAAPLVAVGSSLVAVHDWTFLLGPGFVVGVGNGLILGYLMYRSGLMPRDMAMLGLVGGPSGLRCGDRHTVRRHRGRLRAANHRDNPGDPLGAVARYLPHRQRIQAVSDPTGTARGGGRVHRTLRTA